MFANRSHIICKHISRDMMMSFNSMHSPFKGLSVPTPKWDFSPTQNKTEGMLFLEPAMTHTSLNENKVWVT